MSREDGENLVIVASKGGIDRHPAWYLNLKANPETVAWWHGRKRRVRARETEGAERERLWERMVEVWPDYEDYQRRTERQHPGDRARALHRLTGGDRLLAWARSTARSPRSPAPPRASARRPPSCSPRGRPRSRCWRAAPTGSTELAKRIEDDGGEALPIEIDITDHGKVEAAMAEIKGQFGGLHTWSTTPA